MPLKLDTYKVIQEGSLGNYPKLKSIEVEHGAIEFLSDIARLLRKEIDRSDK